MVDINDEIVDEETSHLKSFPLREDRIYRNRKKLRISINKGILIHTTQNPFATEQQNSKIDEDNDQPSSRHSQNNVDTELREPCQSTSSEAINNCTSLRTILRRESPVESPKSLRDSSSDERKKKIRFSTSNKIHHFIPKRDEFVDSPDELYNERKTCGKTAHLFFSDYALPFMYVASSNITTLYLLIEMTLGYEMNGVSTGYFLTFAYLSRLLFTSISKVVPKLRIIFGSFVSLAGFGLIYISKSQELLSRLFGYSNDNRDGLLIFIIGSILSSTNESYPSMKLFARGQLTHDTRQTGRSFIKHHFQMAKIIRIVLFGGGGLLYQHYGVQGIALLGAAMASLQISCLFIVLILDGLREKYITMKT